MPIRDVEEYPQKTTNQIIGHPLLNRVYQNRGLTDMQDLNYDINRLIPPFEMKGVKEAADLLIDHIIKGSKILVIGDYDCDGATSTTIACEGLRMLGAKNVSFSVPDRLTQGYGLSPAVVRGVAHKKPDLIVTVDNGIASVDGAEAVKALKHKCDLLITDHHLPGANGKIPDAAACVNPNQPGCNFPSKAIAGCGVIFYVVAGLRSRMEEKGVFEMLGIEKPALSPLLDVLALGTVADVVPLDLNNRIMVKAGLDRINKGKARPLIRALMEIAGLEPGKVTAKDFGFKFGPRINAAGRIADMSLAIRGLLAESESDAWHIARELDRINTQRKEMSSNSEEEALEILETENISSDANGVCLYNREWHEGIVGILAGRVKEWLHRPIICMTLTHDTALVADVEDHALQGDYSKARENIQERLNRMAMEDESAQELYDRLKDEFPELEPPTKKLESENADAVRYLDGLLENGEPAQKIAKAVRRYIDRFGDIKGSCRSVEGVHLKHVLDRINKNHPDILNKFGGHAMAAGVGVKYSKYEKFQKIFDEYVSEDLTDEIKNAKVQVDVMNPSDEFYSLETAELVESMGPWGQHFWEPNFGGQFEVVDFRVLKEKHLKMQVRPVNSDLVFDAIAFSCVDRGVVPTDKGRMIDLVFKMEVNEWRNKRNLQLMVDFFQDPLFIRQMDMEKEAAQQVEQTPTQTTPATQEKKASPDELSGVSDEQRNKHKEFTRKIQDDLVL